MHLLSVLKYVLAFLLELECQLEEEEDGDWSCELVTEDLLFPLISVIKH